MQNAPVTEIYIYPYEPYMINISNTIDLTLYIHW